MVANAGIGIMCKAMEMWLADWRRQTAVNIDGGFHRNEGAGDGRPTHLVPALETLQGSKGIRTTGPSREDALSSRGGEGPGVLHRERL